MLRSALGVLLVAITVGCAGTPATPAEPRYADSASSASKKCAVTTGSHIKSKQGNCAPGRSYSGADIRRTGAGGTAEALKVLNPAVDIHK